MPQPVLVIHGIANRDRNVFNATVRALSNRVNNPNLSFIPVFWGDLGALTTDVTDTLPTPQGLTVPGADTLLVDAADPAVVQELLRAGLAAPVDAGAGVQDAPADAAPIDQTTQKTIVVEAARARVRPAGQDGAPAGADARAQAIAQAVEQRWDETQYLKLIQDPQVLRAIGQGLGQGMRAVPAPPAGQDAAPEDLTPAADGILSGIDGAIGAAVGQALGRVNARLRSSYGPAAAEGIGDIFVYQDALKKAGIQARVRQGLPPGTGTPDSPVYVVAHSFGGLIALDMALSHESPLGIKGLITVGSQPGFFQVLQPRPSLPPYTTGHPARLPATIGGWINLWEPLDVLAFLAGPVFQLADGTAPRDREVAHESDYGLYTHGSYWQSPELSQAISDLFQ